MKLLITLAIILVIAANMTTADKDRLKTVAANVLQSMSEKIRNSQ